MVKEKIARRTVIMRENTWEIFLFSKSLTCLPFASECVCWFNLDLFDMILYVPSTIFQLCRDGSSWVEPVLSV